MVQENTEQPKESIIKRYWFWVIILILVLLGGGYILFVKYQKINDTSETKTNNNQTTALWPESDQPWPMFHGNYNHSGYANVSGPETNQLKWKYFVGGSEGNMPNSIAVSKNGTVFVAGNGKITALNADGSLKWAKDYSSPQGPGMSADGQTLYFASGSSVIAASALDGSQKWQFKAGSNMIFGPTIGADNTIYQGSWDKYFYAINADGTLKWKYQTKGSVSYPASIDKNGNIYLGGGDAHSGQDGNVYAFDKDGKLLWTYDTKMLRVGSPAIGYDGLIYFPAAPDLFVLDSDGKLIWKKGPEVTTGNGSPAKAPCAPPPAPCDNAGSSIKSGEPAGGSPDNEDIAGIISPAITPEGVLYIGTSKGKFYAIDTKTEEIKWSYQTGNSPDKNGEYGLPSFVIADKEGTAYFGSWDHKFYALEKDGKLKWTYETGSKITEASPAIGADGTLYFTSEDGYIYAIGI